jgi:hypothetical protein
MAKHRDPGPAQGKRTPSQRKRGSRKRAIEALVPKDDEPEDTLNDEMDEIPHIEEDADDSDCDAIEAFCRLVNGFEMANSFRDLMEAEGLDIDTRYSDSDLTTEEVESTSEKMRAKFLAEIGDLPDWFQKFCPHNWEVNDDLTLCLLCGVKRIKKQHK